MFLYYPNIPGGTIFGGKVTAKFYEEAGVFDKAFALYESLQNFDKAIECCLKLPTPKRDVLLRLYAEAGRFEKVIEIYLESGTLTDLQQALSFAKAHNLSNHVRIIEQDILERKNGLNIPMDEMYAKAKSVVLATYSQIFGIDFGTTNSVAAIFNKSTKKAEIVPSPEGMEYVPSYFGLDEDNRPIFGEEARTKSLTAPDCVISRVKRNLGRPSSFSVGKEKYRSEEVVAKILQKLRLNTEAFICQKIRGKFLEMTVGDNIRLFQEEINEFLRRKEGDNHLNQCILTVPAYFNNNQKRATKDSAEIAGLKILRLLHEPTAAALAYGYQRQFTGRLAVVDLGGGTLDISILEVGDGVYEVETVGGDTALGGSDIDDALLKVVLNDIKSKHKIEVDEKRYPIERSRLRDACEQMKINLSTLNKYTMELPYFLNMPVYTFTMKRDELERIAAPILDRAQKAIMAAIRNTNYQQVECFLLVGNATKMPAVVRMVEGIINAKHLKGINPGTVVAQGAAIQGAIFSHDLSDTLLLDVVPFSLGIASLKDEKINRKEPIVEEMSWLIAKNTTIPTNKCEIFSTAEDNQTSVNVRIYQGESNEPQRNHFLGNFMLRGIPLMPKGKPQIEVTFDIDTNCLLVVTAVDKTTGNKQSIKIEGAVTLSHTEKENLRNFFRNAENIELKESELRAIRLSISDMKSSFENHILLAEQTLKEFRELFHDRIDINAKVYRPTVEQTREIQRMFSEKDNIPYAFAKYSDRFFSAVKNVAQTDSKHFDFSDKNIISRFDERIGVLTDFKNSLEQINNLFNKDVLCLLSDWTDILKSMVPDLDKMNSLQTANYHFTAGRVQKAREILESQTSSDKGLTSDEFQILLWCYIRSGLREEYRDLYRKLGRIFGAVFPDFNRLNSYLKTAGESIFMIQSLTKDGNVMSGSGFCVAPNLIVTNRHVVEGVQVRNINILGIEKNLNPYEVELDTTDDVAVLFVNDNLKPLRIGEFNFVEPGEQVVAIGFPNPDSSDPKENIYISKGIVNSIRKTDFCSERVIFIDAKIGRGISGGPVINDLGEIIGICTLTRYGVSRTEKGPMVAEGQPIALPIHLVRKYLT